MSKKRVAARPTVTLKDFHGGSIPSDLLLPSAPGMTVHVDWSSYERKSPVAIMDPSARGYMFDRSGFTKQGPVHGTRSFEEKVSYLPNITNIGRNYDEDERKPVDGRPPSGHSADNYDGYDERRSYIVEKKLAFNNHYEDRDASFFPTVPRSPELISNGQSKYSQFQSSIPSGHYGYQPASPAQAWRKPSNPQQQADAKIRGGPDPSLVNVWTARREGEPNRGLGTETETPRPPSQNTMARVAEASAIEKVSSGRCQPGYTRIPSPVPLGHRMPEQENLQFSSHFKHSRDELNSEGYYALRPLDMLSGPEISEHAGERALYSESAKHSSYSSSEGYHDKFRVGSYPDISRIALNDNEQGRYTDSNQKAEGIFHLDNVSSTYSETDRADFSRDIGHRTNSDPAWSRNAGYFESERDCEDGDRHRDALQSQYIDETGRKSVERPSNRDGDVGIASIDYSQLDNAVQSFHGTEPGVDAHNHKIATALSDSGKNQYPCSLESSGRFDPLARSKKIFISEGSRVNHLEDPCFTSYTEGPGGTYTRDGGRSSFSLDQALKRSSFKLDENFSVPADISSGSGSIRMTLPVTIDASRASAALVRTDSGERPRLKLLPRSKPVEQSVEIISNSIHELALKEDFFKASQSGDLKQMIDPKTTDSILMQPTLAAELKSTASSPLINIDEDASRPVERPKLSLKPRSQGIEGSAESYHKERNSVYGGARPRELVLKDRSVNDIVIAGSDKSTAASNVLNKAKGGEIDYQDGLQVEKQEKWLGFSEKQGNRPPGRQNDRALERQPSSRFLERQDSNLLERDNGKEPAQQESRWFSERVVDQADPDRLETRGDQIGRHDSRREPEKQNVKRDIDKQDSWRRSSDQPASTGSQNQSKVNYASSGENNSTGYGLKSGIYGIASAEPTRLAALAQSKLAFGPDGLDHHADYADVPGKRVLPLRSRESYY